MNTATFHALADPQRFQMVELLRQEPLTVGEIAVRLNMRQPQTSKHLRVLSDAGVIDVQASANRRICHLRPEAFRELDDWLARYRQLWQERFDNLDNYPQQLQEQKPDALSAKSAPQTGEKT
ncbi:ArsR/SmtB family transcription factor [Deinococcus sp. SM5_A1]|uniref:ArsR/SmtB family transcription factor n=1 Tax=Deinococcus sp. SM5_A1 TaxID=3379094 RepID=UPI00385E3698